MKSLWGGIPRRPELCLGMQREEIEKELLKFYVLVTYLGVVGVESRARSTSNRKIMAI